jgi:eukaryotic-like serine/threonine-protein kinase
LILTGCWDSTARLWHADTGRAMMPNPILPHGSRVRRAAFHPDGHRVLTVCLDGSARLWDLAGSSVTPTLVPGRFSPDGTKTLLQTNDGFEVVELATQRRLSRVQPKGQVREAALNRTGELLLVRCQTNTGAADESELSVWESRSGKKIFSLTPFAGTFAHAALCDTGEWLAAWLANRAQLYDLRTGRPHLGPLVLTNNVTGAFFDPRGNELVILSYKEAFVWDLRQRHLKYRLSDPNTLKVVCYSPDGRLLLTAACDPQLTPCAAQLWSTATGQPWGPPLEHRDGVLAAEFSPDSARVVTASEDFTACLWNLRAQGSPKTLPHGEQVFTARFSPDASCILTVCRDRSARLWDGESGEPLSPPLWHPLPVNLGAFLDNNRFLVIGQDNGWIWPLTPATLPSDDLFQLARLLAGKDVSLGAQKSPPAALQAVWQRLKAEYPEQFRTTDQELIAWHRRHGQQAKRDGQWAAALFHFERLIALQPEDSEATQSRKECLAELERPLPSL